MIAITIASFSISPGKAATPTLGAAETFAALGGSTVTNGGPSIITGDIGVSPGTAITGFPPGIVVAPYAIHAGDGLAAQAEANAATAYGILAGVASNTNLTGQDLGGMTLAPGVYTFNSSAQLTGALTLAGDGNPNSVYIFKIGSTLTTASNAQVNLISGANADNVFWQVGSSATLGTSTAFEGNILAYQSISLTNGATLEGRALALNGAVSMDADSITVPKDVQNSTLYSWGWNPYGQLGTGTTRSSAVPLKTIGLTGVTFAAGGEGNSLALRSDGTVWSWGWNYYGQLGNGNTTSSTVPVQVQGIAGVTSIAAGSYHGLAILADHSVWSWGYNNAGQLGNGTKTNSNVPVQVMGLTGVTAVAGGGSHSLALLSDGTVWAWGNNNNGQLGDGTKTNRNVPVQVAGLTGVTTIAGGSDYSVASRSDGSVWAWGGNSYGQLGDRTKTASSIPVRAYELSGIVEVAAGQRDTLALQSNGDVWAWGWNYYGQLGNGTLTDSSFPVKTEGIAGATSIASGWYQSLAVVSKNSIWAWGNNASGQLGNGSAKNSSVPVQVTGLTTAIAIIGGGYHSMALGSISAYTVTLSSPSNLSTAGQAVRITATVAGDAPTGTIQFMMEGINVGTPVALTNGVATFSSTRLSVGTHSFTASYSGDTNNAPSNTVSPYVHQVNAAN